MVLRRPSGFVEPKGVSFLAGFETMIEKTAQTAAAIRG
jgi:hypothetical protein